MDQRGCHRPAVTVSACLEMLHAAAGRTLSKRKLIGVEGTADPGTHSAEHNVLDWRHGNAKLSWQRDVLAVSLKLSIRSMRLLRRIADGRFTAGYDRYQNSTGPQGRAP